MLFWCRCRAYVVEGRNIEAVHLFAQSYYEWTATQSRLEICKASEAWAVLPMESLDEVLLWKI